MRPIDADALLSDFEARKAQGTHIYGKIYGRFVDQFLHAVEDAPTVDLDPDRIEGKWIPKWWKAEGLMFLCPGCGSSLTVDDGEMNFEYCPYCGMKLGGGTG